MQDLPFDANDATKVLPTFPEDRLLQVSRIQLNLRTNAGVDVQMSLTEKNKERNGAWRLTVRHPIQQGTKRLSIGTHEILNKSIIPLRKTKQQTIQSASFIHKHSGHLELHTHTNVWDKNTQQNAKIN